MKNKIINFLLAFFVILPTIFVFSACGHNHSFSEDWSYDATHHWHEAICKHESNKKGYAEHSFGEWETKTEANHISSEVLSRKCEYGYEETSIGKSAIGHSYVSESIIVEGDKAYKVKVCNCQYEDKQELSNYIVVNPNNAQSILDGSQGKISGKTIVFSNGLYSSLEIRSTADTISKVYEYEYLGNTDYSYNTEADIDNLSDVGVYHYIRNINDVEFVSTSEAVFTGVIAIQSKDFRRYGYALDYQLGLSDAKIDVDPIRGVKVVDLDQDGKIEQGDTAYVDHISLKNISFNGLNFQGKRGRIFIYNRTAENMENITFKNCSFTTNEMWSVIESEKEKAVSRAAINLSISSGVEVSTFKNVTIDNCKIDGHYQGVYVDNSNNLTVKNCEIKNTDHNAIAVQTIDNNTNYFTTGNVLIENNTISNVTDRAIRFNTMKDASIEIKNNRFVSCDENGQLLKSQASTNSNLTFRNNSYNGTLITDTNQDSEEMDENKFLILINE